MKNKTKRAFTLVELLVVISIIALLMTILMPALTEMRRKALSLLCQNRQSNMIKLGMIYSGQNEDKFWCGTGWRKGGGAKAVRPTTPRDMWMGACGKLAFLTGDANAAYVKDNKSRLCPIAKEPSAQYDQLHPQNAYRAWGVLPPGWHTQHNSWEEPNIYGSFGDNMWIYSIPKIVEREGRQGWSFGGTTITSYPKTGFNVNYLWQNTLVKQADIIPVLLDCTWMNSCADVNNLPPDFETGLGITCNVPFDRSISVHCLNRHSQAINVAYVDGSVRNTALKQLWYLKWNRNSRTDGLFMPDFERYGKWMARFKKE